MRVKAVGNNKIPADLLVFSGSFNPVHQGHLKIVEVASKMLQKPVQLELSRKNTDKPYLDGVTFDKRRKQIQAACKGNKYVGDLYMSNLALFLRKAIEFPKATFIVGEDTLLGINNPKNWQIYPDADKIAAEFKRLGIRFLVFQRKGYDISGVSKRLLGLCTFVSIKDYEDDGISSTEIRQEQQIDQIVQWIAGKVSKSKSKGAVFGLSGGLDSAVVAALCKKALGECVKGIIMPCDSQPQDKEDALLLAETIELNVDEIELFPCYQALVGQTLGGSKLSRANMKARLRMATLYYIANSNNYLVAGTGNKSELMTGYFTKYGDGGADILPIGNLYKTEVQALARKLNIPKQIIEKPPSAGLWEGQTDEAELGMSYEVLDVALIAIEQYQEKNVDAKILAKVKARVKGTEHKRKMPPMFGVN